MNLLDLTVLYLVVGAGCAVVVYRRTSGSRRRRATSAAVTLPLWPLWAPIALMPDTPPRSEATGRAARIEAELAQAERAAAGSPFEVLLTAESARRISDELRGALNRIAELDGVLAQPGFDLGEADARMSALTASGSRRALETAVLHRNNVARIHSLRDRQVRAIEELGELVGALRSQLVLARYAGSSPEGVGGIVTELWARVEGLSEAMDAHASLDAMNEEREKP